MKMKKITKRILSLLVVFALVTSLVPVFEQNAQALVTQEDSEEYYHTLSLKVGDTKTLQPSLTSSTGAYSWYTYDSSVVKITTSWLKYSCTLNFH